MGCWVLYICSEANILVPCDGQKKSLITKLCNGSLGKRWTEATTWNDDEPITLLFLAAVDDNRRKILHLKVSIQGTACNWHPANKPGADLEPQPNAA